MRTKIRQRGEFYIVDTIWPDGVRTRPKFRSLKKAKDRKLRVRLAVKDGSWQRFRERTKTKYPAAGLPFKELVAVYTSEYVEVENDAKVTKKCRLKFLEKFFRLTPADSICPAHVTAYKRWRKTPRKKPKGQEVKTVKNATINRDLAVLRHMLGWAKQQHHIRRNRLVDGIKMSKEAVVERPRPTDDIVDAVFAKLDVRAEPMFTFLRETGARREEILSLQRKYVNIPAEYVTITPTNVSSTKSAKPRNVPLTAKAIAAVRAMPVIPECPYVFYHPDTLDRWWDPRKAWQAACKAAGHPWLQIKDLRLAYAIRLAEMGCDMKYIKEVMGHASVVTTEKYYAKYAPKGATNEVGKLLKGNWRRIA
ncbi:MAG TPA: site-specific integrase [Acidobacteriota bacterium]|jgi:integrase